MEIWSIDIGNAYLEAFTEDKLYIIAGSEFGEQEGHVLIVDRALYGLNSGLRWWESFSAVLHYMKFSPSKTENDIWMRDMRSYYEYIARYIDDLAIISNNAKLIIDALQNTYGFKFKGSGPITYHLG